VSRGPGSNQPSLLLAGRLEAIALADVLQILCAASRSGVVSVEQEAGGPVVEIDLHDGRIVGARLGGSIDSLPEETRTAIRRCLGQQHVDEITGSAPSRSLEQLLLEMERGQVEEQVHVWTERVESIVALAMSWDSGLFRFRRPPGEYGRRLEGPRIMLEPQQLILGAARRWDELTRGV